MKQSNPARDDKRFVDPNTMIRAMMPDIADKLQHDCVWIDQQIDLTWAGIPPSEKRTKAWAVAEYFQGIFLTCDIEYLQKWLQIFDMTRAHPDRVGVFLHGYKHKILLSGQHEMIQRAYTSAPVGAGLLGHFKKPEKSNEGTPIGHFSNGFVGMFEKSKYPFIIDPSKKEVKT